MIIDTHAHINMEDFDNDIDQVLENARANHVDKVIVIGMTNKYNIKALNLISMYPNLYAAVGIHPCYVSEHSISDVSLLEDQLSNDKVVAIGETGIDLYWDKSTLELQKDFLIKHIELAIKLDKPIIVHTRNSFYEAYDIIKEYKGKIKGVFHSFSESIKEAKLAIDIGFYVGISGVVTFKNAKNVHEIASSIPLEHILVETDCPYLTPIPYRSKRNEPGYTYYVVDKIAQLRDISVNDVSTITTNNAKKLFKLGE